MTIKYYYSDSFTHRTKRALLQSTIKELTNLCRPRSFDRQALFVDLRVVLFGLI